MGEQMSGEHMPPLGEQLSSVSLPSVQMSVGEHMSRHAPSPSPCAYALNGWSLTLRVFCVRKYSER